MSFIKNGDAEILEIIVDSKQNDFETELALKEIKQAAKNIQEDSNKIESIKELD